MSARTAPHSPRAAFLPCAAVQPEPGPVFNSIATFPENSHEVRPLRLLVHDSH